jgi:hypothetical protein
LKDGCILAGGHLNGYHSVDVCDIHITLTIGGYSKACIAGVVLAAKRATVQDDSFGAEKYPVIGADCEIAFRNSDAIDGLIEVDGPRQTRRGESSLLRVHGDVGKAIFDENVSQTIDGYGFGPEDTVGDRAGGDLLPGGVFGNASSAAIVGDPEIAQGIEGNAGGVADTLGDGACAMQRVTRSELEDIIVAGIGDPEVALRVDGEASGVSSKDWFWQSRPLRERRGTTGQR